VAPVRPTLHTVNVLTDRLAALVNGAVVRTDFSDDAAWREVCERVAAAYPLCGFEEVYVDLVDEPVFAGLTVAGLLRTATDLRYLFLADPTTTARPDRAVLAVDLVEGPDRGRTSRVTPRSVCTIDANLDLANLDFEDFMNDDPDQVCDWEPED
jgi:hypothetical protein